MAENNAVPETLPEFLEWLKADKNIKPEEYHNMISRYLDDKARKNGIPYCGLFELTPLCNLDCKMCYVHLSRSQMEKDILSAEEWKELMQGAIDSGMAIAELSGGECLTYPHFDELYLFLQNNGIEINVFTNGILLDDKRIEFFKAHPPKTIQVTLYGSCEDAYEQVTGHRSFNRVYTNILKAKEAGLPVRIAITPNSYMDEDGEKLVRLADATKLVYTINFTLLEPREDTQRNGDIKDASVDYYINLLKVKADAKNFVPTPVDAAELPDIGKDSDNSEYGTICGAGRSCFTINWKGEMNPCNGLYKMKAYPLRDGFSAAWEQTKKNAAAFRRPVECADCGYKEKCSSCAAIHIQGGRPGHVNPVICEKVQRLVREGLIIL